MKMSILNVGFILVCIGLVVVNALPLSPDDFDEEQLIEQVNESGTIIVGELPCELDELTVQELECALNNVEENMLDEAACEDPVIVVPETVIEVPPTELNETVVELPCAPDTVEEPSDGSTEEACDDEEKNCLGLTVKEMEALICETVDASIQEKSFFYRTASRHYNPRPKH